MRRSLRRVGYHVLRAMWRLLSRLPMGALLACSTAMYYLMAHVIRYRRKVLRTNLAASFPDKSPGELRRLEHDFYRYFCDLMVEIIKMSTMSVDEMKSRMRIDGAEQLDECQRRGQSVAMMLGHYGNWEWVSSTPLWLGERGAFGQIVHTLKSGVVDELMTEQRERWGVSCIDMKQTLRWLVEHEREMGHSVVGYIADQSPKWQNIHLWLPFLGHENTPVFTGTERIARKRHQAVFYLDVQRVARARYHARFVPITADAATTAEGEVTRRYFEMLEATVRRDPACYLWSHKRWKRTREEFDRLFEVDATGRVKPRHP